MLIRHIPHASTRIPEDLLKTFLVDEQHLQNELLRLTDWYTDELFADGESDEVIFPVSRLVCDPERFLSDSEEPAADVGMGVFYTHGSARQMIRNPDEALRDRLVEQYYRPHHRILTELVEGYLSSHGRCFILDCHSFPTEPLPTDDQANKTRPDICLGFNNYHGPMDLITKIRSNLAAEGFEVSFNTPYSGSLIPTEFYEKTKAVEGLMIELNRSVYMNEITGEKLETFDSLREMLQQHVIDTIRTFLANQS